MSNAVYDDQDTVSDQQLQGLEESFRAPSANASGPDVANQSEIEGSGKPSADSPDAVDTPPKADSAEGLKQKESDVSPGTQDDTLNKGYTSDDEDQPNKKRWLTRRKATVLGGSSAITLLTCLGLMAPGAGTLEFLHFAQSIRAPHMGRRRIVET
jgi:hypothetical protein